MNLGYNQSSSQRDIFWNTETLLGVLQDGLAVKNYNEREDYLA